MGVAQQLGLQDGPRSDALKAAQARWPAWAAADPLLASTGELAELPRWLQESDRSQADRVLYGLAGWASRSGQGDRAATAVLAWVLLPGACRVAHQLRSLSPRIDALVAGQLWIEIGTFPWPRLHKVAANVLANTRAGVLADCGVPSQVQRIDRTWARSQVLDPHGSFWSRRDSCLEDGTRPVPEDELAGLVAEASRQRLLEQRDQVLIRRVLAHAAFLSPGRSGRGQSGLMSNEVVAAVAAEIGVSDATVRRRIRRVLLVLAACSRADLGEAA